MDEKEKENFLKIECSDIISTILVLIVFIDGILHIYDKYPNLVLGGLLILFMLKINIIIR